MDVTTAYLALVDDGHVEYQRDTEAALSRTQLLADGTRPVVQSPYSQGEGAVGLASGETYQSYLSAEIFHSSSQWNPNVRTNAVRLPRVVRVGTRTHSYTRTHTHALLHTHASTHSYTRTHVHTLTYTLLHTHARRWWWWRWRTVVAWSNLFGNRNPLWTCALPKALGGVDRYARESARFSRVVTPQIEQMVVYVQGICVGGQ